MGKPIRKIALVPHNHIPFRLIHDIVKNPGQKEWVVVTDGGYVIRAKGMWVNGISVIEFFIEESD